MKIRTQFYLLIGGIVVVPVFILFGFYYVQRLRDSPAPRIPGYEEIIRLTGESVDRESWEKLSRVLEHKPKAVEYTVLDDGMTVLFSTIEPENVGKKITGTELFSLIYQTSGEYVYQLDCPTAINNKELLLLTRVYRDGKRPPGPLQILFEAVVLLLTVLFVFSSAMSVSIARSITQSVMVLEAATRRIASGELDFPIEVRGSNEITSLTASLNSMRDALKEEQTRRSRFIMGVTHDLKTPLALIKGYAEAIGDGLADEPEARDRYVGIIGAKVDQLDGMVDDLIDFVRMDTAEWRRQLQVVDLGSFLRGFTRRMEADARILHRRLESDLDLPSAPAVPMDERLVIRALENIVNNALRYTAEGGLVRFSARERDGAAVVLISDDGPGIAEEDLPRIFEMFYRGSSSRREQGMGLGLSIVRGVVDSHGWEIKVRSEKGRGSEFEIDIPLA